jgi:hypothetical protein
MSSVKEALDFPLDGDFVGESCRESVLSGEAVGARGSGRAPAGLNFVGDEEEFI